MSAPGHNVLNPESELRYIIQWFSEWSDYQRDDFVPIIIDYLIKNSNAVYINGIVDRVGNIQANDKPMNLFQCRVCMM
jgi:hypothetical protein